MKFLFLISVSRWYWSRPAKGHRSGEARRAKAKVQPAIEKSWVGFVKQQNAQGRVDHFCQRGYHNRTQNQNCAARVPLASNILLCRWQGREKIFQLYRQRCGFQPAYMFRLSQRQTGKNTLDLLDFVRFRLKDEKAEKRFFIFIAKDADSNRFVFLSDKLYGYFWVCVLISMKL